MKNGEGSPLIAAVVFDVGGVLELTSDLGFRGKWELRLGLASGEVDSRLQEVWRKGSLGHLSETEVSEAVKQELALSNAQLEEFFRDLWQEHLGLPNFELIEYLKSLRGKYRTAILSDSFVGAREREHERYGFGDLCDLLVYSHEVGLLKPDPRVYALTCERLGVAPTRVLFVDDSPHKVAGAIEAGWQAILHLDNRSTLKQLGRLLPRTD